MVYPEEQVSEVFSYDLVTFALRVSLHHLCYLRGIIPAECFEDSKFDNKLKGLKTKVLKEKKTQPAEVVVFINCLEQAIKAIKDGYVERLTFGIIGNQEGTEVLEEYAFNLTTTASGTASGLSLGDNNTQQCKPSDAATYDSISKDFKQIINGVTDIITTLEPLPAYFRINFKLRYNRNVPEEYPCPKGFETINGEYVGNFSKIPFATHLHKLATPHHGMLIACRSALDSLDAKPGVMGNDVSRWNMTTRNTNTTSLPTGTTTAAAAGGANKKKKTQQQQRTKTQLPKSALKRTSSINPVPSTARKHLEVDDGDLFGTQGLDNGASMLEPVLEMDEGDNETVDDDHRKVHNTTTTTTRNGKLNIKNSLVSSAAGVHSGHGDANTTICGPLRGDGRASLVEVKDEPGSVHQQLRKRRMSTVHSVNVEYVNLVNEKKVSFAETTSHVQKSPVGKGGRKKRSSRMK